MERFLRLKLKNGRFANVTPERSHIMASIRGKRNKSTEITLRMAMVRAGVKGWISHPERIPGKPDFYFPRKRLAIFVDGCFWHGCARCGHIPKTNRPFWAAKIARNRQRDRLTLRALRKLDTSTLRFWEHDVKTHLSGCISKIKTLLR